jgi:hypothetical protein
VESPARNLHLIRTRLALISASPVSFAAPNQVSRIRYLKFSSRVRIAGINRPALSDEPAVSRRETVSRLDGTALSLRLSVAASREAASPISPRSSSLRSSDNFFLTFEVKQRGGLAEDSRAIDRDTRIDAKERRGTRCRAGFPCVRYSGIGSPAYRTGLHVRGLPRARVEPRECEDSSDSFRARSRVIGNKFLRARRASRKISSAALS